MSVRKRKWVTSKGGEREAWIADYTDQAGDRHVKTFGRKKDADAWHDEVRVEVKAGVHSCKSVCEHVSIECTVMSGAKDQTISRVVCTIMFNANNVRSVEQFCDSYTANTAFSRPVSVEHGELERR